jgi:signal peptidase I
VFLNLSTELLQAGYSVRFRSPGHSMHPTIRDGETVLVKPVDALSIRRGDILLYRTERGLTAHRVVAIRKREKARVFILRGDASVSCDEPVDAEQVLGRVIQVERDERVIDLASMSARLRQTARLRAARLKSALLPARRTESI